MPPSMTPSAKSLTAVARTCGACGGGALRDEGRYAIRALVRIEPLGDHDPQAELAGAVEAVVGRDHLRIGVRLGHRDDAEAVRLGDREAQACETLRGGRLRQQVVDQVGGTLAQGADRRSRRRRARCARLRDRESRR